jgi:predicted Zn-dependent peptidase
MRMITALALVAALGGQAVAQTAAPPTSATRQAPAPPDRSAPPTVGPPPRLQLPAVQKHALGNGLRVWVIERHTVPTAQVMLVVKSGSAADPAGKYGLASLTAAMLTEGAGGKGSLAIADELDFLGADLGASSSFDASLVALSVPVARLAPALGVMADVVLRPDFPQSELDRLREQRLTALRTAKDSPPAIASVAFPLVVYGPGHRYGGTAGGTSETITGFTREDLRQFHATHFRPDQASLVVTGDLTPSAVLPLLETAFGGWRAPAVAAPAGAVPTPQPLKARTVTIVDKPGAPQSVIQIGAVGVPRTTPDYFALEVLNTVLGGSFTSRLNQNLREQHGYTYGARSGFDMRRAAGPFSAAASVQTDKTAEAVTEFFKELNGVRAPIPADELAKAKNYVALSFPGEFESSADVAGMFAELIVYDLPDDYYATYVDRVLAVTSADVERVAKQYIVPDRLAVVIVGDRQAIEPKVKALALGPVQVLNVDDVVR